MQIGINNDVLLFVLGALTLVFLIRQIFNKFNKCIINVISIVSQFGLSIIVLKTSFNQVLYQEKIKGNHQGWVSLSDEGLSLWFSPSTGVYFYVLINVILVLILSITAFLSGKQCKEKSKR